MEDGTNQKERKKNKGWHLLALTRQKEIKRLGPTSIGPWRVSQEASDPQTNALNLGNESLSYKI